MPVAEVTVQYLNKREGKRPPSIKDATAGYFGITDEMFDQGAFKVGGKYKVEYTQSGVFKNVSRAKLIADAAPAASHGGGSGDSGLAERIFVCGAINATLGNPNVNPREISATQGQAMVETWRLIWAATFGAKDAAEERIGAAAGRAMKDDMNDEIPW